MALGLVWVPMPKGGWNTRLNFGKAIWPNERGITRKGEPQKGSVVSQKSLATFIAKIIESPDSYIRENLGGNRSNF
jgi:hypothetical protein